LRFESDERRKRRDYELVDDSILKIPPKRYPKLPASFFQTDKGIPAPPAVTGRSISSV